MQPELSFIDKGPMGYGPVSVSRNAAGWPVHPLLQFEVLWPLHVLSLRTLEAEVPDWLGTLRAAGLQELPAPGRFKGDALRVVWSRPSEYLVLTTEAAAATLVQSALRPGTRALSCVVDRTAGVTGIELRGLAIDRLLARLVDSSAIPNVPGHATRARLVDIGVHLLRLEEGRLWLLADQSHADYLQSWLTYASQRIGD